MTVAYGRTAPTKDAFYCSFCAKSQHEVRRLIAGPTAFICDECVVACVELLEKMRAEEPRVMIDGDIYG